MKGEKTAQTSLSELSDKERAQALRRFKIIRPFLEGEMALTVLTKEKSISLRTARRWVRLYRSGGLAALGRKSKSRRRPTNQASPWLTEAIEGLALQKPRCSVATIRRKVAAIAKERGKIPPSYSTVYRRIQEVAPALLTLAHEGEKVFSDAFDLLHRREASGPNEIWQADHTELDIWLANDKGEPKKPWLTVILDDYSRAVAGFYLTFLPPSALHTSLALRQAIWRKENAAWHICGIPHVLYTDHGSDFTSKHVEQVAAELKIRLILSTVGRPRGRGKVERMFLSLTQILLSSLPGYTAQGSKPSRGLLTLPQFAAQLERYLVQEYHLTPHSTTKEPPQSRWEQGGFLPQMPQSLEQLDLLLLTVAKSRRVQQDGIRFMGMRYIDPTLAAYVGEDVILRYDPRDMAEVRLFYNERFLCRAVCHELSGEVVSLREIKHARDRHRRSLRQTIKDRRRAVEAILEARRCDPVDKPARQEEPKPAKKRNNLKRYFND